VGASNLPAKGIRFFLVRCAKLRRQRWLEFSKQVCPKVAAGFGSKNLLDKGS
jgi:hypothetical protein